MNPLVLTIISAVILTIYLVGIVSRYGVLPSISESYYRLGRQGWLFQATLMAVSLLLMIATNSLIMFLAGAGIWYVAFAAKFKEKVTSTIHYAGAIVGFGLGVAYLFTIGCWKLPLAVIICSMPILFSRYKVFIGEVILFYTIIVGLIF